jgi:hypothetical protein
MKRITFAAAATLAVVTAATARSQARTYHALESVRGALVMHGEYPHFVRVSLDSEKVYEIDLSGTGWADKHLPVPTPETVLLTPIFCITARGYEDKTRLGQTGRTTFKFTEITSTVEVKHESECSGQAG